MNAVAWNYGACERQFRHSSHLQNVNYSTRVTARNLDKRVSFD